MPGHPELCILQLFNILIDSGIIAEMLKAAGEEGVELVRLLAETVFSSGDIPKDWEELLIVATTEVLSSPIKL